MKGLRGHPGLQGTPGPAVSEAYHHDTEEEEKPPKNNVI